MSSLSALRAGVARTVITPPIGIPMSGFAGRGPAVGVYDELYATALVLEAGDSKAAVLSVDLLFVGERFTAEVREEAERRTGISGRNVFLCASHTHYGPTTLGFEMEASFEPARKSGTRLGGEVIQVFEAINTGEASGVASLSVEVGFPSKTFGSETETREAIESLEEELGKLQEEGAAPGRIRWCQKRLDRARQALECILRDEALPPVASEVAALRFGDVALLMAPGEVFNEIGAEIKAHSPLADTLFVGYSNGSIGYVPTPEAYPEGGYEVDRACRVAPEASRMLIEEAARKLRELA